MRLPTFFQNNNSRLVQEKILRSDLDEDIFSSPPERSSNLVQFFVPQTALREPTKAPQAFYSEFSLPPIRFPKATVEDCNEDDCDSILGAGPADISSIYSITSDKTAISSDHSVHRPSDGDIPNGQMRMVPSMLMAKQALVDANIFLRGQNKGKGGGYHAPNLDPFIRSRIEGIRTFLNLFTNPKSQTFNKWAASSFQASVSIGHGTYCARQLRKLARAYISDRAILPINPYGNWNQSMLVDEDLCNDLNLYLQELGKDITAEKVVEYLARPEIKEKHGISKGISIRTARRYLNALGFRFSHPKKGQYADGHERVDVVYYRNAVFLPRWEKVSVRMRNWMKDNLTACEPSTPRRRVCAWFHDETIFYAHDRRRKTWYHKDASAKPYAKGEGASLMVARYVSADYGFLAAPDGRNTQRVFKPGKNRDGYFTNEDILQQISDAMDLVSELYPNDDHIFIYDNATTHLKRPDNAPSACKMPKFTPPYGKNWLVEVTKQDENGNAIKMADGSGYETEKVKMADATFSTGEPQPLYFPEGHPRAGVFKGMLQILNERGITGFDKKRAECKSFKCPEGATDCCIRRKLYTQPDFQQGKSNLEILCESRGFQIIFLPKFHCELNFIEQCWGYAKRLYRMKPESSKEDHLEINALECLDAIPIESMRKYVAEI